MKRFFYLLLTGCMSCIWCVPAGAQDSNLEDDIWKQVNLSEVDYKHARNYCQRFYGYYRFIDDGMMYFKERQHKLFRVYEGIYELDILYKKDYDEGATVMVGRDLVHPDQKGKFMEFYELKPYTFLEKARKVPKHYTLKTSGDTTRVYTKLGLAGTIVKDPIRQELHMKYDALAPDTSANINILILKAHLSNVQADALYWYDETSEDYVPQGNLKRATFDGKIDMNFVGSHEVFNEHTELYVDSVVYFTRDEYKQEKKTTAEQRRKRCGYTDADIDRLKQKLGVPPLSAAMLQQIEDQRDWDEEYEQWITTPHK